MQPLASAHDQGRWATAAVEGERTLPPSSIRTQLAACRICDCTESAACTGGCWWVDDPEALGRLCSACLPLVLVAMPSAET